MTLKEILGGDLIKDAQEPIFWTHQKLFPEVIAAGAKAASFRDDQAPGEEDLLALADELAALDLAQPIIFISSGAAASDLCSCLKTGGQNVFNMADEGQQLEGLSGEDLARALEAIKKDAIATLEELRQGYEKKTNAAGMMDGFKARIHDPAYSNPIKTGFDSLDDALDGGLFPGLYIIGAESAVGKTSFSLQIADTIAKQGQDVLMFSVEMPAYELMAKSISRTGFETMKKANDPFFRRKAKTARGILAGGRYEGYSKADIEAINESIQLYTCVAEHVYFSGKIGQIGVSEILNGIEAHTRATGRRPVVFVDYLQILRPENPRDTDKQAIDKAVLSLKAASDRFKIPVICISSFNRGSYGKKAEMTAFKESGGIEYAANCLISLNYATAGQEGFDASYERQKDPRNINACILKNRFGASDIVIPFDFYSAFSYFEETGAPAVKKDPEREAYEKYEGIPLA